MASLQVRPIRAGDIQHVQVIYAAEVIEGTASFELEPPNIDEMRRRRDLLLEAGYPYLVAVNGEQTLAGYAYAGPYRPRPGYRFTVENSVYVAPKARRRGIAGQLLKALIDACETRHYRQMVAVIGDSAHQASIRLHENAGFRRVGTLSNVGFKFDRWLDTVIMQRELGPGASSLPDPKK